MTIKGVKKQLLDNDSNLDVIDKTIKGKLLKQK